jgi:hypothetical protein
MEIPEEIKEMVAKCKERTDHFILSQPERISPLDQCDAISKQINFLVKNIILFYERG